MPEGTSGTFTQVPALSAFSTLYARVQRYVGGPQDSEVSQIAKDGINEAIGRLNTREWTWTRMKDDVTLVAATQEYALQGNFKSPRAAQLLNAAGEVSSQLAYADPVSLERIEPDRVSAGDPLWYTIYNEFDNGKLALSLSPSTSFVSKYPTLRVRYYRRVPTLSADANTLAGPTEVEPFLVWYACAQIAAVVDLQKVPFAESRWQTQWQQLIRSDVMREARDW